MVIKLKIGLKSNKPNQYLINKLQETFQDNKNIELVFIDTLDDLADIEVLITANITENEINKAKNLKILYHTYTGINDMPLDLIKERKITLVNTHAHAPIVALRAFSLALALLGRIVELHQGMTCGNWHGLDGSAKWMPINNQVCGILGMGMIGKYIVKYLQPFNVKLATLERYRNKLTGGNGSYYATVEDLCLNSDLVFISLPLTKTTTNIITEKILTKMENKYLVNVGRGELINEKALYNALKHKTLNAAAIDVWYQYPRQNNITYPSQYPFQALDNIILSPHCSGNAHNVGKLIADEITTNLENFVKRGELTNIVDLAKEY